MKVKTTEVLTSLQGEPLREMEAYDNEKFISSEETPNENPTHTRRKEITLRDVCVAALTSGFEGEARMTAPVKLELYLLSVKIFQNDEVDLTVEEIALVKKRIGIICPPLIVGRAYELLEKTNEA